MQTETITTLSLLKFSNPNSKLRVLKEKGYRIATFSLPAAWTCPGALQCKARVGRDGGLVDGADVRFRCFAASDESQYVETRKQRWHNFDLLKTHLNDPDAMASVISASLPKKANAIRIHVSGDFFNASYFLAWCKVARENPTVIFYAYTKSIKTWVDHRASVPSNFVLTASYGGLYDGLIQKHGLKSSVVVFSIEEANRLNLPIDHDDTHAMDANCQAFALLVHHTQPTGSDASRAVQALKGLGSYSTKTAVNRDRATAVDIATKLA
jgi:hypothetical protein